jgi:hypothetical protein
MSPSDRPCRQAHIMRMETFDAILTDNRVVTWDTTGARNWWRGTPDPSRPSGSAGLPEFGASTSGFPPAGLARVASSHAPRRVYVADEPPNWTPSSVELS